MCIQTQSLGTALLPSFASSTGFNVTLMQLISAYQKNPGTSTYEAVQQFLLSQKLLNQTTLDSFNNDKTTFTTINTHIFDYENNLLWSTSAITQQDRIVLLITASDYSSQSTQGSVYQKFQDGSVFSLSWVSGSGIFSQGGALKFCYSISSN